MCDTLVATGSVTADGVTLFGKNSDREPNEAHELVLVDAADHAGPGSATVRCTYIEIPQVAHTHAVLLAKPFWIWGAEMGANEHGVVIGNEAVFTKLPYGKDAGLIGMDLLRLGLERGATAEAALDGITTLLAEHGQSGNCGFRNTLYYHNSFLIADPGEAWVLETAGPHWAARRIDGIYTISNRLTITGTWDLASPDLVQHAIDRRWCKGRDDFSFARCYSDLIYSTFSDAANRRKRTLELLDAQRGRIAPATVMAALRDHGPVPRPWHPERGLIGTTVCAHAGYGPARGSQTTGSMVSHLKSGHPTHFLTGTAAPCTSLFKPVWHDVPLPEMGTRPGGSADSDSLFWRHELLHRRLLHDAPAGLALIEEERDAVEAEWIEEALAQAETDPATRAPFAARCFEQAQEVETSWLNRATGAGLQDRRRRLYKRAWQRWEQEALEPSI
jgi:secernin